MKKPSLSREAVINVLRQTLPHLRRRFGVVRITLYGSFARDLTNADSDIDLLVELSRPWGCNSWLWYSISNGSLGEKWIWQPLKH